ncbi:hypothetical protein AB0C65_21360 [Nocardia sp. NPDC048505]|uniref:hypothetical protein n=1 Tax=Nocardia sp. NPDC048505 TaxID=3155756 RepID=UPI0033E60B2C
MHARTAGAVGLALAATLFWATPSAAAAPAPVGLFTGSTYPGSGPATSFRLCNLLRVFSPGTTCLPPDAGRNLIARNGVHAG